MDPSSPEQLLAQADALMAAQAWPAAQALLSTLREQFPLVAELHAKAGWIAEWQQDIHTAINAYQTALSLTPSAPVLINLGGLYLRVANLPAAIQAFEDATRLEPALSSAWSNLGAAYQYAARTDEARQAFQTAITLYPGHRSAHYNLGYLALQTGDWQTGWPLLEYRDWYQPFAQHFLFPRWQGEVLQNRSVMIVPEAGHGDLIQFARFADQLIKAGVKSVAMACHPPLVRLFERSLPQVNMLDVTRAVPKTGYDYWLPAMSMANALSVQPADLRETTPYLFASQPQRKPFSLPASPRVGLAWRGNRAFENDAHRSLHDLSVLAPLAACEGVTFVSLQHDTSDQELAQLTALGLTIDRLPMQDFADLADVIESVDLIISVDTAVAHLAGAMAKPCWLLLPAYKTDWRWLQDRDDTPWYPEMTLFRQDQSYAWDKVISSLATRLTQYFQEPHSL